MKNHTKEQDKATAGTWKTEIWNYDKATPPRKEIAIQTDKMRIAVLDCDFTGENPYTIPEEEARANAAIIVRAVNSHEALIEALERSNKHLKQARFLLSEETAAYAVLTEVIEQNANSLKLAKGE